MKSFFGLFKNLFKKQETKKIPPSFAKKDNNELKNNFISLAEKKTVGFDNIKKTDDADRHNANDHNFRDNFPVDMVEKSSKDQNSLNRNNVDNTSNKKESFGLG